MKKLMKAIALTAGIAMLGLTFTACDNTSSESSSGSSGTSADTVTIGVIQYTAHSSLDNCYEGFKEGLTEAGYVEGENLTLDFQNALGQTETVDQLAKNMVSKNYDLVVGIATPAATGAYSAAKGTDVPVVFCAVSDPVSAGLVESMDKSGNNCNGTSDLLNLEAQLKLIRALQPDAKKIGILYTTSEANSVSHLEKIKQLAPEYGFEIVEQGVQSAADIPQAAATLVGKVDCINNFTDNNVVDNLQTVLSQANSAGIPVYGSEIEQVKKGCLASESLDYVALGKQTAQVADQILKGEDPAEMAVTTVEDSYPVINSDVAAQFNITIPEEYQDVELVTTSAE